MIKKASIAFTLIFLAQSAAAQWEVTTGYSRLELDQGLSFDFGAAVIGVGYGFPINDALTITPMLRLAHGIKDDKVPYYVGSTESGQPIQYELAAKIELGQYYGLQIRGEYQFSERAYLFVAPSYSVIETKITVNYRSVGLDSPDFSEHFDRNGFGIGVGAGFSFNDLISAELSYETTDLGSRVDVNTLSAQVRVSF